MPLGVAWKLYPPRLAPDDHELFVDNDLILLESPPSLTAWLACDRPLVLEAEGRHYGRFQSLVPPGLRINSGLFGVPPGFPLESYLKLWGRWQENCPTSSRTWDEQGLVASALTHTGEPFLVTGDQVTNCEQAYRRAMGMHFVGLNRRDHHRAYAEYRFECSHPLL